MGPDAVEVWVRQSQAGDARAFELLYREHARRMYYHMRTLLGPVPEVDDAVQSVFVEAHKNLARFDFSAKFSTWLHGIAVRVAWNVLRARRRRGLAMAALAEESSARPAASAASPETALGWRQQAARLYRHLERVDEKKRIPFVLYYVEELELGEVAARVGASPAATWARIKRARAQVLRAFEREQRAGRSG